MVVGKLPGTQAKRMTAPDRPTLRTASCRWQGTRNACIHKQHAPIKISRFPTSDSSCKNKYCKPSEHPTGIKGKRNAQPQQPIQMFVAQNSVRGSHDYLNQLWAPVWHTPPLNEWWVYGLDVVLSYHYKHGRGTLVSAM